MATNGGSVRDAAARRRRIADRGAERLALITGRLQSLPPPPPPPPSSPPLPPSEPSSTPPCPTSDQPPPADENTVSPSITGTAGDDVASDVGVSDVRPVIDTSETIAGASAQTSVKSNKVQSFPEALTEQTPPVLASRNLKKPESQTQTQTQTRLHKAFSPKQLRPAITASENIRIICSITVAVLVMLADAGFPILGSDVIKKIILFRPLLLLVVTNMTIVAAHYLLQKVKPRSTGEAGFADHLGTVLEWGLLMKTGSSALFMDCSVYSVVLICGMGFLQLFGV